MIIIKKSGIDFFFLHIILMGDGMKINIRKLIVYILIPVILGGIVGLLTGAGSNYNDLIQPDFAPPSIVFPIVWTILYILMGISSYIISETRSYEKEDALFLYIIQLIFNLLWSFVFFTFGWYLLAFIWILVLIALVVLMIRKFYFISKISAYLQIPYLLWLVFASILNLSIFILNR